MIIYVKKRLLDVLVLKCKNKRNKQLVIKLLITNNKSRFYKKWLTKLKIYKHVAIEKSNDNLKQNAKYRGLFRYKRL